MERVQASVELSGVGYAIRIFIGTTIVWLLLSTIGDPTPLWAMVSVVVVSEPQLGTAVLAFRSRLVNTLIGSLVALACLVIFGPAFWAVPVSMSIAVLVCTYLVRVPLSWKIAPVTVALVMAAGISGHSADAALATALRRTAEVMFGSAVAVSVAWVASRRWAFGPAGSDQDASE